MRITEIKASIAVTYQTKQFESLSASVGFTAELEGDENINHVGAFLQASCKNVIEDAIAPTLIASGRIKPNEQLGLKVAVIQPDDPSEKVTRIKGKKVEAKFAQKWQTRQYELFGSEIELSAELGEGDNPVTCAEQLQQNAKHLVKGCAKPFLVASGRIRPQQSTKTGGTQVINESSASESYGSSSTDSGVVMFL